MKVNDYISRKEVISQLEYCLANFTDYKKALEETLDKVKHTRTISFPKGYGRLIDADALEVSMADDWHTANEIANCIKCAPTIIEAYKGE